MIFKKIFFHLFMLIIIIIALYPFYYMFVTSLKTVSEFYVNPYGIPMSPTIENYWELIMEKNYLRYLFNTAYVTFISNLITISICVLGAYAFAILKIKGKLILYSVTIALMAIPSVVVIVPIFQFFNTIKLVDTFIGTSIIYSGFMVPFAVYLLTNFFKAVPKSIIDAARIDGCNDFMILLRILIPISKLAIITLIIMNSLWVWNELIIAMITLTSPENKTLVAEISTMISRYSDRPVLGMAAAVFVALPIMLIYIFTQKYFVKGMLAGAIK